MVEDYPGIVNALLVCVSNGMLMQRARKRGWRGSCEGRSCDSFATGFRRVCGMVARALGVELGAGA